MVMMMTCNFIITKNWRTFNEACKLLKVYVTSYFYIDIFNR